MLTAMPAGATDLTTRRQYLTQPLGIGVAKPRLSWEIIEDSAPGNRGQVQSAYQVFGGFHAGIAGEGSGRLLGQREGGLGPDRAGRICGKTVGQPAAVFLEGGRVDRQPGGRKAGDMEPTRMWEMGLLKAARLDGQMDRCDGICRCETPAAAGVP